MKKLLLSLVVTSLLFPVGAFAADFPNNTITWWAPWFAGKIYAKGYIDGREVAYYELNTAGEATALRLTADRMDLKADGRDVSFVDVEVVDAAGTVVPTSGLEIAFEVTGAGTLAGVDSGNVESTYSYKGSATDSYFGRAQAIVRTARTPGPITVSVRAAGLPEATITLNVH